VLVDLVIARSTDPLADPSVALKYADAQGVGKAVRQLLKAQLKQRPLHPLEFVVTWTIQKGNAVLLKLLFTDKRIDPSTKEQYAIREATQHRHFEIIKVLLADERVDPSVDCQTPLRNACYCGSLEIVKLMLADQRVDPSQCPRALCYSSEFGHVNVVKLLLADQRADPSYDNQYPIRMASRLGHTEVVKLLLADQRVDPSTDDQYCLRWASTNGYAEVVKLLLADARVDPAALSQYSIRWASVNGHAGVARLLLADQRVVLSRTIDSSHPEVTALFLLRRSYRLDLPESKWRALTSKQSDLYSIFADIDKIEKQRKSLLDGYLLSDLTNLCLDYVPDLLCHFDGPISSLVDSNSSSKYPRFSFGHLSTL
jgi:hypothetical protein